MIMEEQAEYKQFIQNIAEKKETLWRYLSCGSFVISALALCFGFDKMLAYDSGDYYPYRMHNAYVGGDAYNYIINGNYATALFVLATMFALLGVAFIALSYLDKIKKAKCSGGKTMETDIEENS